MMADRVKLFDEVQEPDLSRFEPRTAASPAPAIEQVRDVSLLPVSRISIQFPRRPDLSHRLRSAITIAPDGIRSSIPRLGPTLKLPS
jgi:hypothetical protein